MSRLLERRGASNALALALLVLMGGQAVLSMRHKSVTVDEIMYVTAGYYHLETGDFRFNMTNPPLMKVVSALPLRVLDLGLPRVAGLEGEPGSWGLIDQWRYSRAFLYDNRLDADRVLFLARLPIVALAIVLGLYVFVWARELWGAGAGVFALFLVSFSPNILAHARLATQDLGLAAFTFMASYHFWRTLREPRWRELLLSSLFLGLAMATKMTAALVFPIFAAYALVHALRSGKRPALRDLARPALAVAVMGATVLLAIHAVYAFQGSFTPLGELSPSAASSVPGLAGLPVPLPAPYAEAWLFQLADKGGAGGVYFAGEIHHPGLWYSMPAAILIKTPLPLLILLFASLVACARAWRDLEVEWLFLLTIAVPILFFAVFSQMNLGLRYVLLIYPMIAILSARPGSFAGAGRKVARAGLALLALWYVAGTLRIHPHYLAYFNELIGGPRNGYRWLADSNLDWGQDLGALRRYMDARGIEKLTLGYFGSADAEYYGIDYDYLPSVGLAPKRPGERWWYEMEPGGGPPAEAPRGVVAVSATLLASPQWLEPLFRERYAWLREHEPVDQVGYSILIYNLGPR